jgi:3-hydroxybutyryl-CoA dehydrogenase
LEITCGEQTAMHHAEWAFNLAPYWGKEPTLLRKDIRGFVTNRLMYAIYREALTLVENGEATLEDTDKAFRYDAGSWITLMGLFRRMDFEGLEKYATICENIFPQLSNREDVPPLMQKMIDEQARGTQNIKGLYDYTEEESRLWNEAFAAFNKDIYNLAKKYPVDLARKKHTKPED